MTSFGPWQDPIPFQEMMAVFQDPPYRAFEVTTPGSLWGSEGAASRSGWDFDNDSSWKSEGASIGLVVDGNEVLGTPGSPMVQHLASNLFGFHSDYYLVGVKTLRLWFNNAIGRWDQPGHHTPPSGAWPDGVIGVDVEQLGEFHLDDLWMPGWSGGYLTGDGRNTTMFQMWAKQAADPGEHWYELAPLESDGTVGAFITDMQNNYDFLANSTPGPVDSRIWSPGLDWFQTRADQSIGFRMAGDPDWDPWAALYPRFAIAWDGSSLPGDITDGSKTWRPDDWEARVYVTYHGSRWRFVYAEEPPPETPQYRYQPPRRVYPREDGATGGARRVYPPPRSKGRTFGGYF